MCHQVLCMCLAHPSLPIPAPVLVYVLWIGWHNPEESLPGSPPDLVPAWLWSTVPQLAWPVSNLDFHIHLQMLQPRPAQPSLPPTPALVPLGRWYLGLTQVGPAEAPFRSPCSTPNTCGYSGPSVKAPGRHSIHIKQALCGPYSNFSDLLPRPMCPLPPCGVCRSSRGQG